MTRLELYKSLFWGREDIFALRWEKVVALFIYQVIKIISISYQPGGSMDC
jgi:hypothetical protein